ncbi:hypothetical protein V8C44DRAFT_353443 [Trichoderma aethiopicum]
MHASDVRHHSAAGTLSPRELLLQLRSHSRHAHTCTCRRASQVLSVVANACSGVALGKRSLCGYKLRGLDAPSYRVAHRLLGPTETMGWHWSFGKAYWLEECARRSGDSKKATRSGHRSPNYTYTVAIASVVATLTLFRFASASLSGCERCLLLHQLNQEHPVSLPGRHMLPNRLPPSISTQVIAPTLHRSSIAHAAALQIEGKIPRRWGAVAVGWREPRQDSTAQVSSILT